jgi:integrase
LTFHDLRRTGATRLAEAGADAFYILALLGHSDIWTSQVYAAGGDLNSRPWGYESSAQVVRLVRCA